MVKIGRLMAWFDPAAKHSVCGFWWWAKDGGPAKIGLILVPPWSKPMFSERYGSRKPIVRFWGWRLFGPSKP